MGDLFYCLYSHCHFVHYKSMCNLKYSFLIICYLSNLTKIAFHNSCFNFFPMHNVLCDGLLSECRGDDEPYNTFTITLYFVNLLN